MLVIYDRPTQYCRARRDLEERSFNLVGRLSILTDRLLRLIGHDHLAFVQTKLECVTLRAEIVDARHEWMEHLAEHGC